MDDLQYTRLSGWKGGEYDYCVKLVHTKGNKSVPLHCVQSYLELQRSDAKRDGRTDVVEAFDDLISRFTGRP